MEKQNSALASLTATYTDSEGEAENRSSDEEKSESSVKTFFFVQKSNFNFFFQLLFQVPKQSEESHSAQPSPRASSNDSHSPRKVARRLVSYNAEEEEEAPMEVSDEENPAAPDTAKDEAPVESSEASQSATTNAAAIDLSKIYGFSLPPEPKGKCSAELQLKIANIYEKMKTTNIDMNRVIQERKEFRNPSIYEKLIQFCDINELGTNYPPEIYNPQTFGKDSYYEELAKSQKVEMDKLEKTKKETSVTVVTGSKKVLDDADKKRKSKWDQPAPGVPAKGQTLTTQATGTKTTVISAFGSIAKKSKP